MANFAVIENNIVTNVIVAESKSIAEELTGKSCIESTEDNLAAIGEPYDVNLKKFLKPQPFSSWSLDSKGEWQAPKAKPSNQNNYYWDEETTSWIEVPE